MEATIRVEPRGTWRKLVLNRPDKLNAVNEPMLTALLAALDARDRPGADVDGGHLGHADPHVAVPAQHVADGRRDLALREDAGGHLVEERLEEMVVGAVDEGDPHLGVLEGAGGEEPAEPGADDDHVVP